MTHKTRFQESNKHSLHRSASIQLVSKNGFSLTPPAQRKPNLTGLPDNLKSGIENLSGHSMDDVKVHYNSSRPAQLQAHAYAQGNQIHLAPGQEKHLPHEAWHVVQQKQGRVKPTMQLKSSNLKLSQSIIQRKVIIEEVGDTKSPTEYLADDIAKVLDGFGDKSMGKYGSRIKEMLSKGEFKFKNFEQFKTFLLKPAEVEKSEYQVISQVPPQATNSPDLITLYRAMSDNEADKLNSEKKFTMQIGNDYQEKGLKFFATNIGYSINLANKKNQEAIAKFEPMPYTKMVGAVLSKGEVAYGLKEDIGVHDDNESTKRYLSGSGSSSGSMGSKDNLSEDVFKEISSREKPQYPKDNEGHGYVLKYENKHLNFGVKAKNLRNTMPHWKSPIEYFNSLVKWAGFIGRFIRTKMNNVSNAD